MTLSSLSLSWFRGAGERYDLDTGGKSVVVYGPNGSGKSAFVDAIEYIASKGKIGHLQHEYADKDQRNGVRNTHTPEGKKTVAVLAFKGNRQVSVHLGHQGGPKFAASPPELLDAVQGWRIEHFLLRQDEVSAFVTMPKGEKYSSLAPLLGFEQLEFAAANAYSLRRELGSILKPDALQREVSTLNEQISQVFAGKKHEQIVAAIQKVAKELGVATSDDFSSVLDACSGTVQARLKQVEPLARRLTRLRDVNLDGLQTALESWERARKTLRDLAASALEQEIAVLEAAAEWPTPEAGDDVTCPACGRTLPGDEFSKHVKSRLEELQAARKAAAKHRTAMVDAVARAEKVLDTLAHQDLADWVSALPTEELASRIARVRAFLKADAKEPQALRTAATPLIGFLKPLIEEEFKRAPPTVENLVETKGKIEAARASHDLLGRTKLLARVQACDALLRDIETGLRDEIRKHAEAILEHISGRARDIWRILHPGKPIERITLHAPPDKEKAIDLKLTFYGVDQPSPRLTLSEGHRNSLGLSIFLAMVALEERPDRPVVLDDVVTSLDHGHRANIVDVLARVLADRQVIILTHDRSWFAELRSRLPQDAWEFKRLLPWDAPDVGCRWADNVWGFEEARQVVKHDPNGAGNRCRQICEAEMGLLCEKLKVALPYLRGDANDRRTVAEFLDALQSRAKKSLRIGDPTTGKYEGHGEAVKALDRLRPLLSVFANRASHEKGIEPEEASKVIDAAEEALTFFQCKDCTKPVWWSQNKAGHQCRCGRLTWKS